MMNGRQAILLMLSASGHSSRELNEFFEMVCSEGPVNVIRRIDVIRSSAPYDGVRAKNTHKPKQNKISSDNIRIDEHMSMIKEVEYLLLKEARLSKSEATRILMAELRDVDTEYGYLSSPNKIAFRSWLARIGEDVSDSRVLHAASKVRNAIVHGVRSVSDWPI